MANQHDPDDPYLPAQDEAAALADEQVIDEGNPGSDTGFGTGMAMVFPPQSQAPVVLPDFRTRLNSYHEMREVLKQFIRDTFVEAAYKDGKLVNGQLGDFYRVPGASSLAPTQAGAEKVAMLFQLFRGGTQVTAATMTPEFASVRVRVVLVGADGRPRGSGESGCNSAEAGFRSFQSRKKYGARFKKEGNQEIEIHAPDYRAAENDLVSRAGKRAFVQAVRVAAGLDEIFTEIMRDQEDQARFKREQEAAKKKAEEERGPVDAKGRRITMPSGIHEGKPARELDTAYLEKTLRACREKQMLPDLAEVIAELLEERRVEAGA